MRKGEHTYGQKGKKLEFFRGGRTWKGKGDQSLRRSERRINTIQGGKKKQGGEKPAGGVARHCQRQMMTLLGPARRGAWGKEQSEFSHLRRRTIRVQAERGPS